MSELNERQGQALVGVLSTEVTLKKEAQALASSIGLPYIESKAELEAYPGLTYLLQLEESGLELQPIGDKKAGALRVDFVGGAARHRRLYGGGKNQLIGKSVGLHQGVKPSVLDCTAGLGGDAFVLASLGCRVTLLEQSPVVAALLADGLSRARKTVDISEVMSRLTFYQANSIDYMKAIEPSDQPDVVYLDPMFPERQKSAKVKKAMAFFHDIVGYDQDDQQLLTQALETARCRVVVKRPKQAPLLGHQEPSYQLKGKSTRYDIYTLRKLV